MAVVARSRRRAMRRALGRAAARRPGVGLTRRRLAAAVALLLVADWGAERAGNTVFPGGPLDESAHLLTALLFLWALVPRAGRGFTTAVLFASVAIDVDHVPDRLGVGVLTVGTPRPYTHSLTTIAVLLLAALLLRHRRQILLGLVVGLLVHFWRDLSEPGSGVALLWPLSRHAFSLPHVAYLGGMALLAALAFVRCEQRQGRLRPPARGASCSR